MSKELTPLQAFRKIKEGSCKGKYQKYCDIIETALKRLEEIDKPKKIVGTTTVDKALEQFLIDTCPEVKKKLKALEIIKKRNINAEDVKVFNTYSRFNQRRSLIGLVGITKEEYELLKEVLK